MSKLDKQYHDLLREIIKEGTPKSTRSGDVKSIFGKQIVINMSEGLPIITTKKMYINGIVTELVWFINGMTNIKYLVDNNVHIWDKDAYRFYLELSRNSDEQMSFDEFMEAVSEQRQYTFKISDRELRFFVAGDLGPVYGKQWRQCNINIDQLKNVVETLKSDPDDRRMIVSSWNVAELNKMALPPCHVMFQFYSRKTEDGKRKLSLMWTQRSVDAFLGLPFNITSYAILLSIVAQCVGMEPDKLIGSLGDVHIYDKHIDAVNEQLSRDTDKFDLPELYLTEGLTDIDDFDRNAIHIVNYQSYEPIKAELFVGL